MKSAEEQRIKALLDNDLTALADMLHPDLTYGHGSGLADSYDSYLGKLASGDVHYLHGGSTITGIRVLGEVALVWASVAMEAKIGPVVPIRNAILTVWKSESGRWRLLAHQPTRIPNDG